jgi:nucleoid-associated protein YgaU
MMRRERRAAPLFALLVFEVIAIIGLQAAGSNQAMQVPWGDFWTWVDTNSLDTLAMPLLRYAALGLAYWMLASTLLFVAAQLTRIPVAIKAAGMFTLPSVRRAVDGAMAVSIATTSVVGFAGAAVVLDGSSDTSTTAITNMVSGDLSVGSSTAGGDAVATPTFGAASYSAAGTADMGDMDMGDDADSADNSANLSTTDTTVADNGAVDPTTTTTSADDLVTTSTTPSTTSSTIAQADEGDDQATTSLAPSAGSDFVPTPRPGAPITTTTVPQGPSTSATTPAPVVTTPAPVEAPATTSGTHRVVPGDNLWNIARDHLAETSGRDKHSVSEAEIRTYWLKVIDVNRDSLRSHDPHWIFPGEVITLPALDGAPAGS